MPATTLGARRIDRYRKKQSAVDTITSSINSLSTQEKNAVIKKVVENTDARSAVLASGYIKKDKKVEAALNALEQRNKLIAHATASAKMVE